MKKDNLLTIPNQLLTLTLLQMSQKIDELKQHQRETCEMAARSILHALDLKDHYTFGHSMRVTYFSLSVGRHIGLNEEELYNLELAALFHDVGKIGIPDNVLLKPARLDEAEFLTMKKHPEKSAEILSGFKDFDQVATYAKHHHERFDGRGYPDRLKGEEIPFYSRIILIADTFDAMTSTRPYRKGLPYSVAFDELRQFAGSQFDPYLVKNFTEAMDIEQKKNEKTFYLSIIDGNFEKSAA